MEKEYDHSKFIIQRFDASIANANVKGNFLLAFHSFLCGGVIANYKGITALVENTPTAQSIVCIPLVLLFTVGLVTTGFIINAVYPYLISNNTSARKYHSMIFFSSVVQFGGDTEYAEVLHKQSDAEVNEDMARQAYCLAKGLQSKYKSLAWAMRLVYAELFILLILLAIIIIY